jgi:hypothetical protein
MLNRNLKMIHAHFCTSVSEEVDITDNEHGNICAHHVPCNDDIIVISSDCESDSSVSILKKINEKIASYNFTMPFWLTGFSKYGQAHNAHLDILLKFSKNNFCRVQQ